MSASVRVCLAALLGLVLLGCDAPTTTVTAPKDSKPALDIRGVDADGTPLKLSDYRGKVVLLDFWRHT